jgi:hypothetical protein
MNSHRKNQSASSWIFPLVEALVVVLSVTLVTLVVMVLVLVLVVSVPLGLAVVAFHRLLYEYTSFFQGWKCSHFADITVLAAVVA